jgi:hypothetical protein
MKPCLKLLLIGIILGGICPGLYAAPANDNFVNRTVLTGTNVTVSGNNSGAGNESGENIGGGNIYFFYSVWYEWTSPTNGVVYVSGNTAAPNFIMTIGCYRGSAVNALTPVTTTPDGGISVTAGDTIKIKVASVYYPLWGGGGGMGPFTLTLSLIVPAPTSSNDAFVNRLEITAPTYHFDGSIYGATSEPGEPLPSETTQTLWWDFAPPGNGILNLTISSAQFTPTTTFYDGNQFQSITPVAPLNGSMYYLQSGHTYSIQMASGYVPGGSFSLDTRFYSQSNDMFATSDQLEGTNITYYGNFTLGTLEPGEPVSGATNTVWMSWAAPANGYAQVSKATAPQFQFYAVYTGPSLDYLQPVSLVSIGANSVYRFLVTEGTVYHFQFSGGADNFTFYLQFYPLGPCSNDNFADAQVVKGNNITYAAKSVVGATMELGEPAHMGDIPQKSIWWKWQAPVWGNYYIYPSASLVTNLVLVAYTGNAVEALTLVAKSTNSTLRIPVTGGQTYYIAGAVPTNAIGDILNYSQYGNKDTSTHVIPGNLLQEPSWEGTGILDAQYWKWSGSLGGYVNENNGADGTTWPGLSSGTKIWQDFSTIPGHSYAVRFAYLIGGPLSSGGGDAQVAVMWDTNVLGISGIPAGEAGFWHWDNYTTIASNTTSRITFQNLARNIEMDAFSVVDVTAPPAIITQPASISSIAGGTAAFVVGATGTSPLRYQWFFNGSPLDGQTNKLALLNGVTTAQSGNYYVVITNGFGAVTSAVASLTVGTPESATILSQPYGDTVPVGGYYNFSVVAAGTPPLTYQWFLNDQAITGGTNSNLMLTNVQTTDAGTYTVRVQNQSSIAWSLPATLTVAETDMGGGTINFRNQFVFGPTNANAPVFDVDGITPLNSSNYLAQLYAGPSLSQVRPAGQPTPFQEGFKAGYFVPQIITLANVPPGSNAILQVCAWDASYGASYEQARATGGRFGKSNILQLPAGGGSLPPQTLQGLQRFSLQAGLPYFEVGTITFVQHQPPNIIVWALHGQPGSIYLIEKSKRTVDTVWRPFTVITNVTGTVIFTDTADSGAANVWYRARILD